jgi:phosphoglycerate dehydrogenase-like enzyme
MNTVVERSIYARALDAHAEGAEVFIIGTKRYSDDFFRALRPGTLVQRFGVGYNAIPLDLCRNGGIRVGYTPGVLERVVAEGLVGADNRCGAARQSDRSHRS